MTAVEFLKQNLPSLFQEDSGHYATLFEQAKEMEKQQMFDYIKKNYVNGEHSLKFHKEEFEQYYNETYETYGSKGSDECQTFEKMYDTTSATICANCGIEKFLHK